MSDVLHDLARAKVAFQLRAIEAALCADARSKPDQNIPLRAANDAPPPSTGAATHTAKEASDE